MSGTTTDLQSLPLTFLVGCPRSGTTMLAALIDRHSQFAVPPETHFFPRTYRKSVASPTIDGLLESLTSNPRMADLGLDIDVIRARLAEHPVTYASLLAIVLMDFSARAGKPRSAEKTPMHLMYVPEIVRWFPQSRIVCIVRDGRDVALSLRNVPWMHNYLRVHSYSWRYNAQLALQYQREYPNQVLLIRFEDLVQSPQDTLTAVMQFIGSNFEAGQLEPGPTNAVPDWERAWKAKAAESLDGKRCYAWRQQATPHEVITMTSMMQPYLQRFDYAGLTPGECSRPRACREWVLNRVVRFSMWGVFSPLRELYKSRFVPTGGNSPRPTPQPRGDAP